MNKNSTQNAFDMVHRRKSMLCAFAIHFVHKRALRLTPNHCGKERDVKTVRRGSWNARRQHETINAVRVKLPHNPSHKRRRDASTRSLGRLHMRQPSSQSTCKLRLIWNSGVRTKITSDRNKECSKSASNTVSWVSSSSRNKTSEPKRTAWRSSYARFNAFAYFT